MKSLIALMFVLISSSAFAGSSSWYCSGHALSPVANHILSRAIDRMNLRYPDSLEADPTYINDLTFEQLRLTFAENDSRRSIFPQEVNGNIGRAVKACSNRTTACVKAAYSKLVARDFCR